MKLVVVGASLAGLRAVEAARKEAPDAEIVLVGAEPHVPYDRPPLSKDLLAVEPAREHTEFRTEESLRDDLGVELRLGAAATSLDVPDRTLALGDDAIGYDSLVIATGSSPRHLPGAHHLDGVHVLRTVDDARAVRAALEKGARTVVVGAGFIGAEVASAARSRGLDVTVVEAMPTPLARAVGSRLGVSLAAMHEANGTRFLLDSPVAAVEGDGHVEQVRLADGAVLPADLVVVGVGATPNTEWLESSALELDNGIVCDETLRAADGVWAAGDVARWHNPLFERSMRIEHWTNAAEQGMRAGRNAVATERAEAYSAVPYFWSDWYGSRIQFVGVANDGEVEVVAGALGTDQFVALYREDDRLTGVLAVNGARHLMRYRKLVDERASFAAALELAATLPPLPPRKS